MLSLLHKTLKGNRNIQGFALIRAVLYHVLMSKYVLQTVLTYDYVLHFYIT